MADDTKQPELAPAAAPADPVADAAPVAAAAQGEPAAAGAQPTVQEAQAMFADNPGLAWILTDAGNLSRDGVLTPVAVGE